VNEPAQAWNNRKVKLVLLVVFVFALHAAVALRAGNAPLSGDEPRYWQMAENLVQGGFASQETRLLWNGPGYPLTLVPWVWSGAPFWMPRLMNAFWLTLAALALFAALKRFHVRHPTWHAGFCSVYLLLHGSLSDRLMSEPLSAACSALALYGYALVVTDPSQQNKRARFPVYGAVLLALGLGYLALTKVIFGYVLLVLLAAATLIWVVAQVMRKRRLAHVTVVLLAALIGAHLVCAPYLVYTYALTGKLYYWGNSGGAQLYGMTLPESRFLGDWHNSDAVMQFPEFYGEHSRFYSSIDTLDFVTQDERLKSAALANIRAYPGKFFFNWRANVNRMVFGQPVSAYPGSGVELKSGNRSILHALWFYALLAVLAGLVVNWRKLDLPGPNATTLAGPLLFTAIGLGGLSVVSTEPRLVFALLPVIYGTVAYGIQALMSTRPPTPGMLGAPAGGKVANSC
jgi:hypothetical protein